MIPRIAFRLFVVCLCACAAMTLYAVWFEHGVGIAPLLFQVNASSFIVGLASFLIWFSLTLKSLHALLRGNDVSVTTPGQ